VVIFTPSLSPLFVISQDIAFAKVRVYSNHTNNTPSATSSSLQRANDFEIMSTIYIKTIQICPTQSKIQVAQSETMCKQASKRCTRSLRRMLPSKTCLFAMFKGGT
jgi:hypothetical protein